MNTINTITGPSPPNDDDTGFNMGTWAKTRRDLNNISTGKRYDETEVMIAPPTPRISPTLSKIRPTIMGKTETQAMIEPFSRIDVNRPRPRDVPEPNRLSKTRTLRWHTTWNTKKLVVEGTIG